MPFNDKYWTPDSNINNRMPHLPTFSGLNHLKPSQNDARQMIEREMEPYLFSAKNDLKIMIENFTRDLGDYKFIRSELNLVKEAVLENKKLILISKEDNEKKIADYSEKFYMMTKQFDDLRYNFNDTEKKFKNYEKTFVKIEDKIQSVESIKDKIAQIEMTNRNLSKKIDDENFSRGYLSNRVKEIENKHEVFEKERENLYEQIENFKNNSLALSVRLDDVGRTTDKIYQNESQINLLKEKVCASGENFSNLKIKHENLDARYNYMNDKISENESFINEEFLKLSQKYIDLQVVQNNFKDKLLLITDSQNILKNERISSKSSIDTLKKQIEEEITKNKTYLEEICQNKLTTANEYTDKCKEDIDHLYTKTNNSVSAISKILSEHTTKIENIMKEKQLTLDNHIQILNIDDCMKGALEKINNISKQNQIDHEEMKLLIQSVHEKHLEKELKREHSESLRQIEQPIPAINEEQRKINLILQNGLEKLIHQIISISSDVSSLKSDNHRFEENFVSVEKNFQKLNDSASKLVIMEKKQNLVNEIIKTLTLNYDNDKKNIQTQYDSMTRIQKESIEKTIKIFNGLKSDYDKKLSTAYEEILSQVSRSISQIESKNLINDSLTICDNKIRELTEQNDTHREKIEKAVSKLINITVEREFIKTSHKLLEAEEKWAKISNYLKHKIEHIEEFINFMSSKYDINYDQGYEAVGEKVEGNQNNVTKMEPQNIEEEYGDCSNYDNKEYLYNLVLYPSGVVNNFMSDKFTLQTGNTYAKEIMTEVVSAEGNGFSYKSKRNSIDEKYEKNVDDSKEKFVKNMRYLSTDPINYHEIKNEMKGYLNKYLVIPKQYENILEFDGEDNYIEIEPNSQIIGMIKKKPVDDSHSFGKEKEGDMVYFLGDENEFLDDDFDKNSDEINIY